MTEQPFLPPLERFYQWEKQRPDAVWLSQPEGNDQWRDYTWAQVGDQARRMAAALQELGLKHGDKVGLYGANTARWVMTDIAIMMAGGVSVPIYASMPEDKLLYIMEHSDMTVLFADDSCAMNLDTLMQTVGNSVQLISLTDSGGHKNWTELINTYSPVAGSPVRAADDLWSISYTSGTTGKPKGVMHSFETLPYSVAHMPEMTKTNEQSVFFSYLPLAHIAERGVVELHSLYCGGHVYFNESRETFVRDLLRARPTFFLAVPRIWHNLKAGIVNQMGEEAWKQLLKNPEAAREAGKKILASMGLERVTYAFSGSAPIPATDIEAWMTLGMPLYEGFGQSETLAGTANTPDAYRFGSIGKMISDEAEMKITEEGELCLRSQGNMLGYYKDPEKTAETIIDGWIHTGDKVRVDEDGFVFITGRVKDIFKTAKGKYVAPAPIEQRFGTLNCLEQLCLVGRGLPQTILLVVLNEPAIARDKAELAEELQATLNNVNAELEVHERISHIVICQEDWSIENEMLTHTLKIKRDEVEEKLRSTLELCVAGTDSPIVWE
ncbi:AMP-binding protein [Pseudomaricurvus alkylphenolicus]|uniref:AMP-binding protein n=1 Tax=Pseudomaricurvus alkylphenolicus TaxID=1306991 RepID=UPI00142453B2|nr:AMP-binding protein [Pseudomaricurvus alkylphenolicus]NIB44661.1 AMP-binding protein [Pseudomaricurvus alkylphenolicus]